LSLVKKNQNNRRYNRSGIIFTVAITFAEQDSCFHRFRSHYCWS